jgi:hypothetical protein
VYATKTESYEHGLEMMNRLSELQLVHGWDEHETYGVALSSFQEPLPITLHKVGKSKFGSVKSPTEALEHVQLFNLFLCRKADPH